MPTVPVLQQRATTRALATPMERPVSAGGELAQLGRQVAQTGNVAGQIGLQEYERASVAAITQAKADLENERTRIGWDEAEGFFRKKGEAAFGQDDLAFNATEERRRQLAASLADDYQRNRFLQETEQTQIAFRRQLEVHVGQQRETAMRASVEARSKAALDAVALNYRDDDFAALQMRDVEQGIQRVIGSVSGEAGAQAVADWRKAVVTTRADKYLAADDYAGASTLLRQYREDFGVRASEYEEKILGAERQVLGREYARQMVAESLDDIGRLDRAAAMEKLAEIKDPAVYKITKEQLVFQMSQADQAFEEARKAKVDAIRSMNNTVGWWRLPQAQKDELNRWDPKAYEGMRARALREARARSADQRESAAARREQERINRDALNDFRSRATDEQASLDVDSIYEAMGVDESGRLAIKAAQRGSKNTIEKVGQLAEGEFVTYAKGSLMPAATQGVTKRMQPGVMKNVEAVVRAEFQAHVAATGKPPNLQETNEILLRLQGQGEPKEGWLGSTPRTVLQQRLDEMGEGASAMAPTPAPAAPAAPPAPPARTEVERRRLPNGEVWVQYSDGTFARAEAQ